MKIKQRVRLRWYPYCAGEIIEVQEPLIIGNVFVTHRYKVKWDLEEHGTSEWLSDYDITRIIGLDESDR